MGVFCTRVHLYVLGSVLVVDSAWLPYKVVARVRDTIKRHSEALVNPLPHCTSRVLASLVQFLN